VVLALGVLLTDIVLAAIGLVIGAVGIVSVIALGNLAVNGVKQIF
jgi:hypothetical protein